MIKTTRWYPDTCGCILEYQWDTDESVETRKHTFTKISNNCECHIGLTPQDIYTQVTSENQMKNKAYDLVLQKVSSCTVLNEDGKKILDQSKVSYSFDASRKLNLVLVGATATQITNLKTALNSSIGTGKVTVNG